MKLGQVVPMVGMALLLSACAGAPKYANTQLPKDSKQAYLRTDSQNERTVLVGLDKRIYIVLLDGSLVSPACLLIGPACNTQEIFLDEGRRNLRLRYDHFGKTAYYNLWLDAVAGKRYIVRSRTDGNRVQMWIEDEVTKELVGGVAGSEPEKNMEAPSAK